ncbi:MAG: hypothetical protein ACT4N5_05005 [Nitrosopumilaceae archaeon]
MKKKLENTSKENDITVNKLITGILEDHFAWDEFGSKLGLMIMLRSFYMELMDLIDRDKIKELAQTVGKEDLKALITFVHGRITINSVVKETEMYFKKIHVAYRLINRNDKLTLIVENNLGNNWPYYVVSTLNSILLEIGYKIVSAKYEKKSFSFEIIKKQ